MPRIAIVGSCITRDLWPIRGGGAERLLYISWTSFPSLLAAPWEGLVPSEDRPAALERHEHRAVLADLQKTALGRLVAFQPTHVIFDFIDERFDLLSMGRSVATESSELVHSGYLAQAAFTGARRIPRLSPAAERLWLEAAAEFAELFQATSLRRATPILHSARWATHQASPDGIGKRVEAVDIVAGQRLETDLHNAVLERYETALLALFPSMAVIAPSAFRLADPHHRWGLSPFHYVPEYYDEARRQLAALGLADAFSDRTGEPSSPAA